MSVYRWIQLCLLALLLAAAWTRLMKPVPVFYPYAPKFDSAVEFYTKTHSAYYAGIDQWSYAGMDSAVLIDRLQAAGFDCLRPQVEGIGGSPNEGIQEATCTQHRSYPIPRDLVIKAQIDYGHEARLAGATAYAIDDNLGSFRFWLAEKLRRWDWLEPSNLEVTGLSFPTADLFAQYLVDAISTSSWRELCADSVDILDTHCSSMAKTRRQSGFPAIPADGAPVGPVDSDIPMLATIGMYLNGAFHPGTETIPVRLDGDQMWLDFVGRDLAGQSLRASILLDPHGGTPRRLDLQFVADTRTVKLNGSSKSAPYGQPVMLLPGNGGPYGQQATAKWLTLPSANYREGLERFARDLGGIDPRYVASAIQAQLERMSKDPTADEAAGLYAPLTLVDHLANNIRRARLPDYGTLLPVRDWFPNDPKPRAAWALATCENLESSPPAINPDCWLRFALSDPDAVRMLRQELAQLAPTYIQLDETHPVRMRLQRLKQAIAMTAE